MMRKGISYYLLLSGQILFVLLFSSLSLQILFSIKSSDSLFSSVPVTKIGLFAIVLSAIALSCFRYHKARNLLKTNYRLILFFSIALWIFLQLLYIYSTYSKTDSDAYVVNLLAWNLTHDLESGEFFWQYFARYQNNLPLLALTSVFYRLTGHLFSYENSWIVLAVISGLLADLAIYWTVKLSAAVSGCKEAGLFSFICAVLLIGFSEQGTIFYTDIVILWTVPCSLYYLYLAFDLHKKTAQNVLLSGTIIGAGGLFKPQIFILPVAVFIVRGLLSLHSKQRDLLRPTARYLLSFFAVISAAFLLTSNACTSWYASVLPEEYNGKTYLTEQKFPSLHWINMGLNKTTYGAYSLEDVNFTGNIIGIQAKKEALYESVMQRLEDMSLPDLLLYENKKVVSALQNGTFSQGMVWKGTLLNDSSFAQKLQPHFVSIYPQWKHGIGLLEQLSYLFCLLLSLYLICRDIKSGAWIFDPTVQIMNVALIGAVCFIALLEQNMRYFYSMIPILIVLSSKGLVIMTRGNHNLSTTILTNKDG